jgi:phosphoribosyl 1,2-cyclic phosphodiesterase
MQLKILGSSSKGNCYLLDNGKEALAIECGISFKEVQKAVNFDVSRIKGAIVSHEHGDHAKHVENFIQAHIPVYMSTGTLHAMKFKKPYSLPFNMEAGSTIGIGNFMVQAFNTQHDAAEPFGFLIYHPECGMVLFATDTYYLHYTFAGLNNILIECNFRQDILDANVESGKLPSVLRARTMKSHMEYETCKETLLANDLSGVNNIVLIHLSDGNSNASEFRQGIMEATGKTIHIAESGMTINFDKSPF